MACVSILQMTSTADVQENLAALEGFFVVAHEGGAKMLVLPENFAFMGMNVLDKLGIAEEYGEGEVQNTVSTLAKRYGLWVIAGSVFLRHTPKKVKTSCLVYNDKGENVARYDKIHLFDACVSERELHQESLTIERGSQTVLVNTPFAQVGLSICYDLRFPELYHQLVLKGAELLIVPAAFTAITGEAHWEVLLRARAIENLCYVLGAGQVGSHTNGRHTHGHSMIVDPWGKILCQKQTGTGVIFADVDLQHLQQLRQKFPCNDHHQL